MENSELPYDDQRWNRDSRVELALLDAREAGYDIKGDYRMVAVAPLGMVLDVRFHDGFPVAADLSLPSRVPDGETYARGYRYLNTSSGVRVGEFNSAVQRPNHVDLSENSMPLWYTGIPEQSVDMLELFAAQSRTVGYTRLKRAEVRRFERRRRKAGVCITRYATNQSSTPRTAKRPSVHPLTSIGEFVYRAALNTPLGRLMIR